jgi:hypothetical protein
MVKKVLSSVMRYVVSSPFYSLEVEVMNLKKTDAVQLLDIGASQ